jgi:cytohesin
MDPALELVRYSFRGNIEEVKRLLDAGADINKLYESDTPLSAAAGEGNTDIVYELILRGAKTRKSFNRNRIPLNLAAARGFLDIAFLLLNNGADVNTRDINNDTPLHAAIRRHYVEGNPDISDKNFKEMINLLIERGADVNAIGHIGRTPLHIAAVWRHSEIITLLHANRANMNIIDDEGKTPMDITSDPDTVELLRRLGGQPARNIPFGSRALSSVTGLFKGGGRKTKKRAGRKIKSRKHRTRRT